MQENNTATAQPPVVPELTGRLGRNLLRVPEAIDACTGIRVMGRLLKSFVFSTDVAIARNCNADAIIAVYPFTPLTVISQSVILAANKPVFCGVGGGITTGDRALDIAVDAEFHGASGVVLNHPSPNALIQALKRRIDIPVVVTVVSREGDIRGRIKAGADILNVAGGADTASIVRHIRRIDGGIPILATGGKSAAGVEAVIRAGANAISYTPLSSAELFKDIMRSYRDAANRGGGGGFWRKVARACGFGKTLANPDDPA